MAPVGRLTFPGPQRRVDVVDESAVAVDQVSHVLYLRGGGGDGQRVHGPCYPDLEDPPPVLARGLNGLDLGEVGHVYRLKTERPSSVLRPVILGN